MNCPTCGARTRVTNSDANCGKPENYNRRLRRCVKGHKFRTIETYYSLPLMRRYLGK